MDVVIAGNGGRWGKLMGECVRGRGLGGFGWGRMLDECGGEGCGGGSGRCGGGGGGGSINVVGSRIEEFHAGAPPT